MTLAISWLRLPSSWRRILVNHAKSKQTLKRGGDYVRIPLDDVADAFSHSAIDLIALDEAMERLAMLDETQHRLVELRFFGGMTTKQCARLLGISNVRPTTNGRMRRLG